MQTPIPTPAADTGRASPPAWITASQAHARFGLSRYALQQLGARSAKLGPAPQHRRLYDARHIEARLAAIAEEGADNG